MSEVLDCFIMKRWKRKRERERGKKLELYTAWRRRKGRDIIFLLRIRKLPPRAHCTQCLPNSLYILRSNSFESSVVVFSISFLRSYSANNLLSCLSSPQRQWKVSPLFFGSRVSFSAFLRSSFFFHTASFDKKEEE